MNKFYTLKFLALFCTLILIMNPGASLAAETSEPKVSKSDGRILVHHHLIISENEKNIRKEGLTSHRKVEDVLLSVPRFECEKVLNDRDAIMFSYVSEQENYMSSQPFVSMYVDPKEVFTIGYNKVISLSEYIKIFESCANLMKGFHKQSERSLGTLQFTPINIGYNTIFDKVNQLCLDTMWVEKMHIPPSELLFSCRGKVYNNITEGKGFTNEVYALDLPTNNQLGFRPAIRLKDLP